MMKLSYDLLFSFLLILPAFGSQAQTSNSKENLVPNGSFEDHSEELRRYGELNKATPWQNATESPADAFSSKVRMHYVAIPSNYMGSQEAFDGSGYAGLVAYSNQDRRHPRSSITVKLNENLKKNKLYCVSFYVSLGDMSAFAVNGMGFALTKNKVSQDGTGPLKVPDYRAGNNNQIIDIRDGWKGICTTIMAKGDERYLTIGDFENDMRIQKQRLDTVAGMGGKQYNVAYYYVDNVKVEAISDQSQCDCAMSGIVPSKLIYSSNPQLDDKMTTEQKLEACTVFFHQFDSEITPGNKSTLDKVAAIIINNPGISVDVDAHTDKTEAGAVGKYPPADQLDNKRGKAVINYLSGRGIAASRLNLEVKGDNDPLSDMNSEISLAKNRRVSFKLAH